MKVLVIGANGQIGQILVSKLQEHPLHTVKAAVRKTEQLDKLLKKGTDAVLIDLEGSVDSLKSAMIGMDAVIFSAGSGGSTGADKTLTIDLDGAVKTMEAAVASGIQRFILVSSIMADDRRLWQDEKMKTYLIAKHYADQILKTTALNYTIVRPGALLSEPGNGKVQLNSSTDFGTIPREDVAETLIACLDSSQVFFSEFNLVSGDTPIKTAVKQFKA